LAQDDNAALLGECDCRAADRLHQRTPFVRMCAAELARDFGRVERLVWTALSDHAEKGVFDRFCVGARGGLFVHAQAIADSRRGRKIGRTERPCYFSPMTEPAKGDRTRARILDEAVDLASVQGLGGLTIGPLADRLGLSKSGLFAHFQSKEALQVETLDRAAERSRAEVTEPLRAIDDRSARLRAFFERRIA